MSFGIPYAYGEIVDGQLFRICPACGARCPERTDATGEETTNAYGAHYEEYHAASAEPPRTRSKR